MKNIIMKVRILSIAIAIAVVYSAQGIRLDLGGGKVYEGDVVASNIRHGHGKMTYPNGACYEGDWINDKMDGFGTALYENSSTYIGNFVNGKKHGNGTMFFENDGWEYTGQWFNGEMHGHGVLKYHDGDTTSMYDGDFSHGKKHGSGVLKGFDDSFYEGNFSDDKLHGDGKMFYSDGSVYIGRFQNGLKEGQGLLVYSNGNIDEEIWDCNGIISSSHSQINICSTSTAFREIPVLINGEVINLLEIPVRPDGNCGYEALGIERNSLADVIEINRCTTLYAVIGRELNWQIDNITPNEKNFLEEQVKMANPKKSKNLLYTELFIKLSAEDFNKLPEVQQINKLPKNRKNPLCNYLFLGNGKVLYTADPTIVPLGGEQHGIGVLIATFLQRKINIVTLDLETEMVTGIEQFVPSPSIQVISPQLPTTVKGDTLWLINEGAHFNRGFVSAI